MARRTHLCARHRWVHGDAPSAQGCTYSFPCGTKNDRGCVPTTHVRGKERCCVCRYTKYTVSCEVRRTSVRTRVRTVARTVVRTVSGGKRGQHLPKPGRLEIEHDFVFGQLLLDLAERRPRWSSRSSTSRAIPASGARDKIRLRGWPMSGRVDCSTSRAVSASRARDVAVRVWWHGRRV